MVTFNNKVFIFLSLVMGSFEGMIVVYIAVIVFTNTPNFIP